MSRFLACAVLTLAASTASAVPIPSTAAAAAAPAHEHRAWAALLTGNSENMTTLALVQVASLRRFSAHKKHITMVTPEVNEVAKARLRAAGSHVVPVDLITPNWKISASWWETVFTKLQIFSLGNTSAGRVDQVAFVDLDAFIVSERADTVFDACDATELCAVQDAANLCINPSNGDQYVCAMGTPGSSAMLNAGVMVARPSASLLAGFKARLAARTKPYLTLPEQEFLSSIYLDGTSYAEPERNRFRFIPASYGQCWANNAQLASASIVHNCGPFKYGHHPLCEWETDEAAMARGYGEKPCAERLLAWSEGPDRAREPARQKVLAIFQQLYVTANPCAPKGRSPATCAAATPSSSGLVSLHETASRQCGWCGEDPSSGAGGHCLPTAACLPEGALAPPAKKAQAERWQVYLREREWLAQQQANHQRRGLTVGGGSTLSLKYWATSSCAGNPLHTISPVGPSTCTHLGSGSYFKIFCDVSTPYVEFYSDAICTTAISATSGHTCPYLTAASCPVSAGQCFDMVGITNARYSFTCPASSSPPHGVAGPPMPPGYAAPPGFGLGGPPPGLTPTLAPSNDLASPPPPPKTVAKPAAIASPPPAAKPVVGSPPAAASPSLPPAAPGLMVAQRVKTEFVLAGTVETFDSAGFKKVLLAVFTDALDVTLTVSAASIKVVSAMDFASTTAATAAAKTIDTTPVAEMQSAWFAPNGMTVTIENTPAASVSSVVIDPTTVANPAALPSSVAAKLQEPQPNVAGIVLGLLFGLIFLLGAAVFVIKRNRVAKLFPSGYDAKLFAIPKSASRPPKPRKSRVLPEIGIVGAPPPAQEIAGTAPLIAGGSGTAEDPRGLAVAESQGVAESEVPMAVPVARVKGEKMPSILGGRRGVAPAPLAVPLATASEQGYKVPPLSPQHRAEAAEEEKKRLPPIPPLAESKDEGGLRDDRSETSATHSESASTAMVTGGGPAATRMELLDQQMAVAGALPPIASTAAAPPPLPPIDPADKH